MILKEYTDTGEVMRTSNVQHLSSLGSEYPVANIQAFFEEARKP
jgi:hypothetical protein